MHLTASSLAFAALAAAAPSCAQHCFPYGDAKLPSNLTAPNVPLDEWWCPQSMAYGFQGFSYPMENGDCNAYDNSFDHMDQDFRQMKQDFGASIIRMYYPVCTDAVIFERAIEAAAKNSMALIFQVWTNFGGGDVWKDSQQAIYDTLDNPKYHDIAPYVVHMADFGSEPVGDGMDGASDGDGEQFTSDLGKFRQKMNQHGILAGISEDWDRPGRMSSYDGNSLGPVGKGVQQNSDVAHIHAMPFYHFNKPESEAWGYIQEATEWVLEHVGLPTMITESQWAWAKSYHNPGKTDVGVEQYRDYWRTFDDNCEWFKEKNVGWFLHAWRGEDTFDIFGRDGQYVIPSFRPRKC